MALDNEAKASREGVGQATIPRSPQYRFHALDIRKALVERLASKERLRAELRRRHRMAPVQGNNLRIAGRGTVSGECATKGAQGTLHAAGPFAGGCHSVRPPPHYTYVRGRALVLPQCLGTTFLWRRYEQFSMLTRRLLTKVLADSGPSASKWITTLPARSSVSRR